MISSRGRLHACLVWGNFRSLRRYVLRDASWISLGAVASAPVDGREVSWVCRLVAANKIVWLRVAARIVRGIDCRCLSVEIEASAVRRPWLC